MPTRVCRRSRFGSRTDPRPPTVPIENWRRGLIRRSSGLFRTNLTMFASPAELPAATLRPSPAPPGACRRQGCKNLVDPKERFVRCAECRERDRVLKALHRAADGISLLREKDVQENPATWERIKRAKLPNAPRCCIWVKEPVNDLLEDSHTEKRASVTGVSSAKKRRIISYGAPLTSQDNSTDQSISGDDVTEDQTVCEPRYIQRLVVTSVSDFA